MFRYRFGGRNVSSNVAVNGIRRAPISGPAEIQVTFRDEAAPRADRMLFSWGGRYDLRLETSGEFWRIGSRLDGTFLIEPGGRVVDVYCSRLPPPQEAMDILCRRVLPRVVTVSGKLAIHAAAVSKNGAALLLLGASGAGKSTTAAYLAQAAGWEILSDDFSILANDGQPMVEPGTTGMCLWQESCAALDLDPARCVAMPGYEGKLRFEPGGDHQLSPSRLRAFIVLERDEGVAAPVLRPLARAEILVAAIRQLVLFNPAAPPLEERASSIARLNDMIRVVPGYALRVPRRFSTLAAISPLLEPLLAA